MATRTRVKICGITRAEDARLAARFGADAIGLVFYAPSARSVDIAQAQAIVQALPPFITVVGLFVDPEAEAVQAVLDAVPLDLLQFHGNESPAFCGQFSRPYIKAVPMAEAVDLADYAASYDQARGLLVDSHGAGKQGGSGMTFDWSRLPRACDKPIILAGGLHPGNVAEAIRRTRPYAVDVSSGVESARGIKDPAKIEHFMRSVVGEDHD